ncbi:hypothetical protein [Tenggerimyces flavus]|uniref:Uncharacterized protein n=1 Tax=Tenggerimyces flavus TaxID=1708749 RepID=A0ABV7YLF6_9ACTN|nr:hypothetical protein [Tenggerimyces flavus]MBM7785831.1 hypothetical protein [Tenggerimyces flavus]
MNVQTIRKATGLTGLIAAILTLIEVPLYFVYSGPPPDANVLFRSLLGLLGLTLLFVFITGIRQLIKEADRSYEWLGTLTATAGGAWLTVLLVSTGLEVGAVIAAPDPIDPTISVSGTYLLYGTIARLLEGLFALSLGIAVIKTAIAPRWVGRSAIAIAAINAAFVPSMFFGNVPANFYAANGWGTTASMGALTMIWLIAVNVAILRAKQPKAQVAS